MGERVPEYLINNKRRKVVQVVPVALATPTAATCNMQKLLQHVLPAGPS